MKTVMLEVRDVSTASHLVVEVTGTWPRVSSPTQGKALARRKVDRVGVVASLTSATDAIARMTGTACEDVMSQILRSK